MSESLASGEKQAVQHLSTKAKGGGAGGDMRGEAHKRRNAAMKRQVLQLWHMGALERKCKKTKKE
ncbi:hypothetical protein U9M48_023340 [Paspalum notatum var. saurae]|uniref:Uncharacterized protein n=1 Tax=Paspalum notatum var. saurae TaxID=547442 RepID=A0AAQ3WUL3_PASNO